MVCLDCKVCVYMFECSCLDLFIVGIICKYVYVVCCVVLLFGVGLRYNRLIILNELKFLKFYVKGLF